MLFLDIEPNLEFRKYDFKTLKNRGTKQLLNFHKVSPEMSATEAQLVLGPEPEFEFNPAIELALRFRIEFVRVQA